MFLTVSFLQSLTEGPYQPFHRLLNVLLLLSPPDPELVDGNNTFTLLVCLHVDGSLDFFQLLNVYLYVCIYACVRVCVCVYVCVCAYVSLNCAQVALC